MMHKIHLKRAYEDAEKSDGYRVLVDRLWPRGIKKEALDYAWWPKDIAPSEDVRKAFNHEEDKFNDFKKAYIKELNQNGGKQLFLDTMKDELRQRPVTFLYAAKDPELNQAVVLKEWTEKHL